MSWHREARHADHAADTSLSTPAEAYVRGWNAGVAEGYERAINKLRQMATSGGPLFTPTQLANFLESEPTEGAQP